MDQDMRPHLHGRRKVYTQAEVDKLVADNEQLRGEVEAERALKWMHFENAAKFDEEVRELKKLLATCEQKTWEKAIEAAKKAEATFYVEFADAVAKPTKLMELAAAKTVVAALEEAARSQGEGKR